MVTADYVNGDSDYAVLWLDGKDDFETEPESNPEEWSLTLTGSEIRKRVAETIWPPANSTSVWTVGRSRVPAVTDDRLPKELEQLTKSSGILNQTEHEPYQIDTCIWDSGAKIGDDATTVTARFTSDMVDEITQRVKRRYDWETLFRPPSTDEHIADVRDATTSNTVIPVTVPKPAALRIINQRKRIEMQQKKAHDPPEKPSNPFNDVQCWACGAYWWLDNGKTYYNCPQCETPVDYEWNIETGRISERPSQWGVTHND